MNIVWVPDTYSTATIPFEEMFTGAAFEHISGSFSWQLPISETRLLWSRLGNGKKENNQYFLKCSHFNTLHWLFYIWHVYIINIHIFSFNFFQTCIVAFLFCFVLFLLTLSQNLLEDILHRVTLTKTISNATQASGRARLSFHILFLTLISFVSALVNVNWDGKEKHQVSVSFY